jgi:hypothetical protein
MTRLSRIGTGCLATLLAAMLVSWLLFRQGPPPATATPVLPSYRQVERITARCLDRVTGDTSVEFAVPAEYFEAILRALGKPKSAGELTSSSLEVAVLRLGCRDGREVLIRLYFDGKEPARYSVDGILALRSGPYVGDRDFPLVGGSPRYLDESNIVAEALSLMRGQPIDDRSRSEIRMWLAKLDRSAGRTASEVGPALPPR